MRFVMHAKDFACMKINIWTRQGAVFYNYLLQCTSLYIWLSNDQIIFLNSVKTAEKTMGSAIVLGALKGVHH